MPKKKPNRRPNRTCEICEKPFYTRPVHIRNGRGRFCSRACVGKAQSTAWTKYCEYCEQRFKVTPATQDKKFCCPKCWGLNRSKIGRVIHICQYCGKEFEITLSTAQKGYGKFCSRICCNEMGRTKEKTTCGICGKEFFVVPSKRKKGYGQFCSYECMGEAKKGENNPAWVGGTSFEPYGIEFNDEKRFLVRKRDGFLCQICDIGENEKSHAVHHIDYDKSNNESENLITLCDSCHGATNHNREWWQNYLTSMVEGKAVWKQLDFLG